MMDGPPLPPVWLGKLVLWLIPVAYLALIAWRLAA